MCVQYVCASVYTVVYVCVGVGVLYCGTTTTTIPGRLFLSYSNIPYYLLESI